MNPNIIKKNKIIFAGVSGDGNKTAEIWKRFIKLYEEYPLINEVSDDGYEVRIFDSTTGEKKFLSGVKSFYGIGIISLHEL